MRVLSILFLILVLLSCSGSPPVVLNSDWMVVYHYDQSRGGIYSELNFFAQLSDEDGIEDISELSLLKDDQGWGWHLDQESWVSFSEGPEHWLGANGLTWGGTLPFGSYRLLVVDRSGQRNEELIRIDDPGFDPMVRAFPFASFSADYLRINDGGHQTLALWIYNDKGDLVKEHYTKGGLYRLDEILNPEELQISRWMMIYVQDEEGGFGLKSGPFLLYEPEVLVDPNLPDSVSP